MKKKISLELYNKRVHYNVEFRRSITIIQGNSGTGKTTLINMLKEYRENRKLSGIKFNSNISIDDIFVLDSRSDEYIYNLEGKNKLYFADEHVSFVRSKRFVNYLKESGSYLVYISRSNQTGFMQYSVDEIYELRCEKVGDYYLNKLYNLYEDSNSVITPDIVTTEDEASGFDIVSHIFKNVDTARGKDNVSNKVSYYLNNGYSNIYLIVDGAAFGNQIASVLAYSRYGSIYMFLQRSPLSL